MSGNPVSPAAASVAAPTSARAPAPAGTPAAPAIAGVPAPVGRTPWRPEVGVVIATSGRRQLLGNAIEAALRQDYPGGVRVVVVYDRAEPDPGLVSERVRVIANSRTPGLAGARNTGILALDTELVGFCDVDDTWSAGKLAAQVAALAAAPAAELVTCAIEVEYAGRRTIRRAGREQVTLADLTRSRMAMMQSSTFLARRSALLELGLVAEEAPGSQNEDWDLLLRVARRSPIAHVDEPLVRVRWGRAPSHDYEYATRISSLRWMIARHPELRACRPGSALVYGQLACWSAAAGNRRGAWRWARQAVRHNWREPRTAIALAVLAGAVRVETVLAALHRRGHGL